MSEKNEKEMIDHEEGAAGRESRVIEGQTGVSDGVGETLMSDTPSSDAKAGSRAKKTPQMRVVIGPDGMAKIDIPPELLTKAVVTLEENLEAKKRYKNSAGEWEESPDFAVRQKAVETLLAYGVGLPVQRQLQIRGNFTSWDEKLAKLMQSPEGAQMLQEYGIVSVGEKKIRPPSSAFKKGGDKSTEKETPENDHS